MNLILRSYLTRWVKKHPHGWDHDDWVELLAQLKKRGFKTDEDRIGQYIEAKHQDYYGF